MKSEALKPDCQLCQERLPAVLLGLASKDEQQEVTKHLKTCPECQHEAEELKKILTGIAANQTTPAPKELHSKLMAKALAKPRQNKPIPWILGGITGLAVAASLLILLLRPTSLSVDPTVVVATADGQLVYANSGQAKYPIVIVDAQGKQRGIELKQAKSAWFTEGINKDGLVYLVDAANDKLIIVDLSQNKVMSEQSVPAGPSGLAAIDDEILVKGTSSATLAIYQGTNKIREAKIANKQAVELKDVMDAVLIIGDKIFVTNHLSGELYSIDTKTKSVIDSYKIGRAPVGLAIDDGRLFVLDVAGALYAIDPNNGKILNQLSLTNHPDKIIAKQGKIYLSDRSGLVIAIDAKKFQVIAERRFENAVPMDLSAMPDGHIALAAGPAGVLMLNDKLATISKL